ncbi:hypothetical protein [Spirochaeta cellobiosiphila]|uniref:hypothetical protein n=1 Tax=Spirochaeta cellobiosiphila TaxID=504483 RepID=UPI00040BACB6|nr:hypothetical protein [Spirochaeta cellobiosiphila]
MKVFLKTLGIISITIVAIIAITVGTFAILALLDHGKSSDYFPTDSTLRIEVTSVGDLIEELTDWEVSDIVLSEPEMKDIYQSFLEWKNNPVRENFLVKRAMSLDANILFNDNFDPLIIINMGWRSFVNRIILWSEPLLGFSPIEIKKTNFEGHSYFTIIPPKKTQAEEVEAKESKPIYVFIKGKILLISTNEKFIQDTLMGAPFAQTHQLNYSFSTNPLIKIHLNTQKLVQMFQKDFPDLIPLSNRLNFNKETLLAVDIKKGEINLEGYTPFHTDTEDLVEYLSYDPGYLRVPQYLPDSVNILTGFRFRNFDSLINLVNNFIDNKKQINLSNFDVLTKSILGLSSQELVTDWLGREAGAFTLKGYSSNPVMFVEIENQENLDKVFEKLKNNLFIKAKDNLVIDKIRVASLNFPAPLMKVLEVFTGPIDTPYMVRKGNYLYLSNNPETLAHLLKEIKGKNYLSDSKSFKNVTGKLPSRSPFLFYYDLNSAMPRFLLSQNVLAKIFRLYEKGHFYISYHQEEIRFQFHGDKSPITGTTNFPGFPVDTHEKINSQVIVGDIGESALPELSFLNTKNEMIITNMIGIKLSRTTMPDRTSLLKAVPQIGILTYGSSGFLSIPIEGIGMDQQEKKVEWDWTFDPTPYKDGYIIFDKSLQKLIYLRDNGSYPLPQIYTKNILAPPSVLENRYLGIYPKDIFGTYYITDDEGIPLASWPQRAGSVAIKGPQLIRDKNQIYSIFLTQKGILEIRDVEGSLIHDPVEMEGTFYSSPAIIKNKREHDVVIINKDGDITIFSLKGEIQNQFKVKIPNSETAGIIGYDINDDGIEELFLYGAGSKIYGWTKEGKLLEGFPVEGHFKPVFTDLDSNGIPEMITGGLDRKIYAYTVRYGIEGE